MKKKGREEQKGGIFAKIVNIIFGILLVIFSIVFLLGGYYWQGGLTFLFAIFLFFPQKILKFNRWLRLLIVAIAFLIMVVISRISLR